MRSPIQTSFEDLPDELAVFPLAGTVLLPWGRLPLNIFEPRYLNMMLDALKSERIIGMIQPDQNKPSRARASAERTDSNIISLPTELPLYAVGCAGRIASFEETEDGRMLVSLKGIIRFRVTQEIEGRKGYRRVKPVYDEFKADMDGPPKVDFDRDTIIDALKPYLDSQGMKVNMDVIKNLSDSTLVTSLCMICPFDSREKQALLECATLQQRAETLTALLQMGVFDSSGKPDGPRQ